jgi:hypothetical protein
MKDAVDGEIEEMHSAPSGVTMKGSPAISVKIQVMRVWPEAPEPLVSLGDSEAP